MGVRRIVANIAVPNLERAGEFYSDFLGLNVVMNHGWIMTFATDAASQTPQISIATEGGSGTAVPDLSIEVDDVDATYRRAIDQGLHIEYEITNEPWGVRRFYVRDPFGKLVNILSHR